MGSVNFHLYEEKKILTKYINKKTEKFMDENSKKKKC